MIYAFNSISEEWRDKILLSLKAGIGRFGWSYNKAQNLNSDDFFEEKNRCRFLLKIVPNDYVVYVNMPSYGKCTLAKVSGTYFFKEPMDDDFNHCFNVDKLSVRIFDRNENIVPPIISARLKLRGRYQRIYYAEDFNALLEKLYERDNNDEATTRTIDDNIFHFFESASDEFESIVKKIYLTHPNFDLEKLMCKVFENSSRYICVEHKRGSNDKGADIILISRELPTEDLRRICLVQVKSFKDELVEERAIDGLEKAYKYYPDADCSLIVSTATKVSGSFLERLDVFGKEQGKPTALLYGKELAKFIIKNL